MKTYCYQTLCDGTHVRCREVRIHDLDEWVLVTTEEVQREHIKEGSADDDLFYCYTPVQEFENLCDCEFEDYVNENYE